jgi:uncharacterized protein YciI
MIRRIALLALLALLLSSFAAYADGAKQYIYIVKMARPDMLSTGPTDEEMAALGQHMKYLDELTKAGKVYVYGRTQTTDANTFGIVIYDAADDAEAEKIMKGDPAVAAGVFTASLYPYDIAYIRK